MKKKAFYGDYLIFVFLYHADMTAVIARIKKIFILYIYQSKEILQLIKTGEVHSGFANEEQRRDKDSEKNWFWRLIVRAFFTTFLIFFTIVYLHQGSILFNADGSTVFNEIAVFELLFSFVFFLSTFLLHRGISYVINEIDFPYSSSSVIKKYIEAVLVIVSSTILLFVLILVPFYFTFPDIEILPKRVRFNTAFMAILSLFFYYFVERERSKRNLQEKILLSTRLQKENLQAQLEGLKNQINPHFLFNSFNVLSSLITHNKTQARKFVSRLAILYRALLAHSEKELVSLEEEMRLAEAYIYLLNTRFGSSLQFTFDIQKKHLKLLLPPGSLQMLIENAVKHNASTRKKPLNINITSEKKFLIVKNNRQARLEKTESTRTGLQNIRRRYEFLSNREVELKITDEEFVVLLPLLEIDNS